MDGAGTSARRRGRRGALSGRCEDAMTNLIGVLLLLLPVVAITAMTWAWGWKP
ncbi:hypothetical protein CCP3SC15_1500009 [Gammaproteobacteria bacterium]